MKAALRYLLNSECADDIVAFLRSRGGHAHIVAPEWLRQKVFGGAGIESAASWSALIDAEIPPGKSNVIVIADDADQEQALVSRLGAGVKVYGFYAHVFPALLCKVNGMAAGKSTRGLKRYAMLCIPRSGSRYLASMLAMRGVGVPREHLREPLARVIAEAGLDFGAAIAALERFGQLNHIFGTKLISTFLVKASRGDWTRLDANMEWMAERGYRFFHLDRPLSETVVSSYIAFLMRTWHYFDEMDEATRAKLDSLEFEEGAAWDEFIRFRAENTLVRTLARKHNMPSIAYAEIETNVDGVIARVCRDLDIDPDTLAAGPSGPTLVPTRVHSPTYANFAERLGALLERRRGDADGRTVDKIRAIAHVSREEAEKLLDAGR